jgi:glycosyltransferase involved in cell wall biosynthesis
MRDSSRLLRKAGHQVFFLADRPVGPIPECEGYAFIPGLSTLDSRTSASQAYAACALAFEALETFKPDVVHLVDQFDWRFQRELCRRYPVVFTAHLLSPTCPSSTRYVPSRGPCEKNSGWSCLLHQRQGHCLDHFRSTGHRALAIADYKLRRWSLEGVREILAVSRYVERSLIQEGWPKEKIHLVYNPVEIPTATEPWPNAPEGLMVCAARLEPYKGVDLLLRALPLIKEAPWTLWICGDGSEKKHLQGLSQSLGISSRVEFLGRTSFEETQRRVKASRCLVQPNLGPEPFGLSVAEASALGVPVVTTDVPAFDEIIEPGVNGLIAERHPASLASALGRLLRDSELARALSQQGPEIIRKRFSPEAHLEATLQAYVGSTLSPKDLPSAGATRDLAWEAPVVP